MSLRFCKKQDNCFKIFIADFVDVATYCLLLADPITAIPGQVASPGQPNIGGAQASPTSQSGSAAQYPAQHTPATRTMPN